MFCWKIHFYLDFYGSIICPFVVDLMSQYLKMNFWSCFLSLQTRNKQKYKISITNISLLKAFSHSLRLNLVIWLEIWAFRKRQLNCWASDWKKKTYWPKNLFLLVQEWRKWICYVLWGRGEGDLMFCCFQTDEQI